MNKDGNIIDFKRSKINKSKIGFFDFDSDDFLDIGWSDSEFHKTNLLDSDDLNLLVDLDDDVDTNINFRSFKSQSAMDKSLVKNKKNPVKRLTFKLNEIIPFHTLIKMSDF